MSLSRWKARSQPKPTFWPVFAAIVAPSARQATPAAPNRQPMAIFPISSGSRKRFAQSRQNPTIRASVITETMESTDTSKGVGTSIPKRCRSALLSAHRR